MPKSLEPRCVQPVVHVPASTPRLSLWHAMFMVLLFSGALGAAGCASTAPHRDAGAAARAPERVPALPDVPSQRGPLAIDLAYPRVGASAPDADSTFLFGTVGDGAAALWINDLRVPVAANGAFLAYVPVPADGRYRFEAQTEAERASYTYAYERPRTAARVEAYPAPRQAVVISGRDTLATGSEIASGAPSPGADRRWFFPAGARLSVTGELGDTYRVRLTEGTDAYVAKSVLRLEEQRPRRQPRAALRVESGVRSVDLRVDVHHAPFLVETGPRRVVLTVYGASAPAESPNPADPLVHTMEWTRPSAAESARLEIQLAEPLWGFKAFYDADGALVLRLRRPPEVTSAEPLRGLRVMVDAGHPPGGAIGPTGLTEAEANLDIARRLASMLRSRGADVVVTRDTPAPLESATSVATELWARVDLAVEQDVDVLVSIHNNAFPDGVNPFERYGTETYYFHGFAQPMAEALVEEMVEVTGLPNLGAKQRSLALTRPSWMPAVLTESLFMMFPQQEAALRNDTFLDRLAFAHLHAIERYVRAALESEKR